MYQSPADIASTMEIKKKKKHLVEDLVVVIAGDQLSIGFVNTTVINIFDTILLKTHLN